MYLIDVLKHTCINFMYFSSINMHLQMKFNKSITFLEGDWGKKDTLEENVLKLNVSYW